jgi:hypothetical protein
MIKKYILSVLVALSIPALVAYAATPTLTVTGAGDNNNVTVRITGGEINAPITLYSTSVANGNVQGTTIGTTDASGTFVGNVSTNGFNINGGQPVYVQVDGYQSNSVTWPYTSTGTGTGSLTFSNISPTVGTGQTGAITISGGSGSYYISSNSNPNGVTPTISGNTLSLYGAAAGPATIVVCSTGGGCGTVTTSVGTGSTVGAPILSQTSLNVGQGSQGTITLSGGTSPYTVNIPSGSGVSTTLVGNTLYVNGNTMGSTTIQVCSANNAGCTYFPVTIGSPGSTNSTNTTTTTTTNNNGTGQISFVLPVMTGQPLQLSLTGGIGSYYLASPVTTPATATLTGNVLTLAPGTTSGSGTVTVCQTGASSCLPISFTVTPALTGTGGGYLFDTDLYTGQSSQDVMELQSRLKDEGYFTGTATGYFGPLTQSAVKAYQSAHGISSTGYVGPLTRAELNK